MPAGESCLGDLNVSPPSVDADTITGALPLPVDVADRNSVHDRYTRPKFGLVGDVSTLIRASFSGPSRATTVLDQRFAPTFQLVQPESFPPLTSVAVHDRTRQDWSSPTETHGPGDRNDRHHHDARGPCRARDLSALSHQRRRSHAATAGPSTTSRGSPTNVWPSTTPHLATPKSPDSPSTHSPHVGSDSTPTAGARPRHLVCACPHDQRPATPRVPPRPRRSARCIA